MNYSKTITLSEIALKRLLQNEEWITEHDVLQVKLALATLELEKQEFANRSRTIVYRRNGELKMKHV